MSVVINLDEFNFQERILDSLGISVVFFSGPHCASCHHLKKLFVHDTKQFIDYFKKFQAYEVKADVATALVNEFNVFHLPTMFLYNKGEFHCELHAEAHPKKIIEAIELALNRPAEEEP